MGEKQPPYPHRSEINRRLPVIIHDSHPDLGKGEPDEPEIDEEEQ